MEFINALGINGKLLVTQLINFVILMIGLTYLVYKPILRLLDERRERVKKSMDDVKFIEEQKKEIENFKAEQFVKVDTEMTKFMDEAKKQAEKTKKEILSQAQKESDALLQKAKLQLQDERVQMAGDFQSALAMAVVKLSASVLQREFSKSDQERILQDLEKKIPSLLQ